MPDDKTLNNETVLFSLTNIPRKVVNSEKANSGNVILLKPKPIKGLIGKLIGKFLQKKLPLQFTKITLDKIGSETWNAIDGKVSIEDIAEILFLKFKDKIEPRYERTTIFLKTLEQNNMVTFQSVKDTAVNKAKE